MLYGILAIAPFLAVKHTKDVLLHRPGDAVPQEALEKGDEFRTLGFRAVFKHLLEEPFPARSRRLQSPPLRRDGRPEIVFRVARVELAGPQIQHATLAGQ